MADQDRAQALQLVPVSHETERRLAIYADLLRRWQSVTNLVAPKTLPHLWVRHFADSAQLLALARGSKRWVDLGSGAGFPGIVIALCLRENEDAEVRLIGSDGRKCAFLRTVIRETGAPATVVNQRIETAMAEINEPVDVVTARALAPIEQLLAYSNSALQAGATGLFLKGRSVDSELTAVPDLRSFRVDLVPSRTDSEGRIVVVRQQPHAEGS